MKKQPTAAELQALIANLRLNKVYLAALMPMPVPTFKNKLNPKQTAYRLTDEELSRLTYVLREIGWEIAQTVGK